MKNTNIFFYHPKYEKDVGENLALNLIDRNLQINGYTLEDFQLPSIATYIEEYEDASITYIDKINKLNLKVDSLKVKQKNIYDAVLESLKQKKKKKSYIY